MFNTLYTLEWENYYDRRVHPDLLDIPNKGLGIYLEYALKTHQGVNFNPNDHINTEVILNITENEIGNYLIVTNEDNTIVSRWYIIEAVRVRGGQYKLILHRDVITDYWNIIRSSPALIEKCNLSYNNPLLFNNEDMTFNQIKTDETLLKDNSNCPWIVAYVAKNRAQTPNAIWSASNIQVNPNSLIPFVVLQDPIEDYLATNSVFYGAYRELEYRIYPENYADFVINGFGGEVTTTINSTQNGSSTLYASVYLNYNHQFESAIANGVDKVGLANLQNATNSYTYYHSENDVAAFLNRNGRIIQDGNDNYYRMIIKEELSESIVHQVASGSLYNLLSNVVSNSKTLDGGGTERNAFSGSPNSKSFGIVAKYNKYVMTVEPITSSLVSYNIPNNHYAATEDAQYDILAFPYGEVEIDYGSETNMIINKDIELAVAQAMAKNAGSACYDIQLVPYCPLPDAIFDKGKLRLPSDLYYSIIRDNNDAEVGLILNIPKANFTTDLIYKIPAATTSIGRKVNNECDKWRLCSPNFSNYFDFSVEKNGGVQYFNVDCCYKPYTPYIHINPNFNGLYGQDFNDPRGLVCGGDFSLSQVTDAWQEYQLQNKNFQQTFDRQIQNMEFNNRIGLAQDIFGAVAGTGQGAVSGAASGAMIGAMGGPVGMAAGAAVGGSLSGVGGVADIVLNQLSRSEALDYNKDLFGYQLGNIKALPYTLSKISALNDNNKIFPVLEYYTATDIEKEALVNKVAYNGMTNMTIGRIEQVLTTPWTYEINNNIIKSQNYIKAKPIHLLLGEDFHMADTIAKEMNLGFYVVEEE